MGAEWGVTQIAPVEHDICVCWYREINTFIGSFFPDIWSLNYSDGLQKALICSNSKVAATARLNKWWQQQISLNNNEALNLALQSYPLLEIFP